MSQSEPIQSHEPYLIQSSQLLTMGGWGQKEPLSSLRGPEMKRRDAQIVGLVESGVIAIESGTIRYAGPAGDNPYAKWPTRFEVSLAMPAWVECHTHALFGGHRANEFTMRNAGAPYVEILEAGGGILSTVDATRKADDASLISALETRLWGFAARGVASVEVKTGYGLSTSEELRHLSLIQKASERTPVKVFPTFLGAHAVPAEHREEPERYVNLVIESMLPRVAKQGIATSCDVFCDRGAFSLAESERILRAARDLGLDLRIHAEELTHTGSAQMAARLGARSADHLDHLDDEGITTLAQTGCVGVLLPGVTVFLDMADRAPARELIDRGAAVALSTDFNPGSCMTQDLALMTTLGCTLLKMTAGEALWAVTAGASRAIGGQPGMLERGLPADIVCFQGVGYAELPYFFGRHLRPTLLIDGELVPRHPSSE